MSGPGMEDARKYPRFELEINAQYRLVDAAEPKKAVTRNVCAEGLCFFSDEKLSSGTGVELELDIFDGGSPVKINTEVKWSEAALEKDEAVGKFMNGVRILGVARNDLTRFVRYYCDLLLQKYGPSV